MNTFESWPEESPPPYPGIASPLAYLEASIRRARLTNEEFLEYQDSQEAGLSYLYSYAELALGTPEEIAEGARTRMINALPCGHEVEFPDMHTLMEWVDVATIQGERLAADRANIPYNPSAPYTEAAYEASFTLSQLIAADADLFIAEDKTQTRIPDVVQQVRENFGLSVTRPYAVQSNYVHMWGVHTPRADLSAMGSLGEDEAFGAEGALCVTNKQLLREITTFVAQSPALCAHFFAKYVDLVQKLKIDALDSIMKDAATCMNNIVETELRKLNHSVQNHAFELLFRELYVKKSGAVLLYPYKKTRSPDMPDMFTVYQSNRSLVFHWVALPDGSMPEGDCAVTVWFENGSLHYRADDEDFPMPQGANGERRERISKAVKRVPRDFFDRITVIDKKTYRHMRRQFGMDPRFYNPTETPAEEPASLQRRKNELLHIENVQQFFSEFGVEVTVLGTGLGNYENS